MNNNTTNIKHQIIDLVNKIKYEVTEEQMAELKGCASPLSEAEFVDWHAKIDNLDLRSVDSPWLNGGAAAKLRELLHRIAAETREIGGRVVKIGRRAIKWVLAMLERFPKTAKALVIMAALCFLASCIPVLRYVLVPLVQTAAIFVVGLNFVIELAGNAAGDVIANR